MNILQCCSLVQILTNETVSFADIGNIIGISRQYVAKVKTNELEEEKIALIEKKYNVKLPRNFKIVEKEEKNIEQGQAYPIPYWEGCSECSDMLKRDGFNDLKIDIELINSWNVKPEDLRIIAMPGEDMDGGEMPIRNKDLLVIDTSRNNIVESGVFFCTTHGNSRVYVRRIIEKMTDDVYCVTTVDNLRYKSIIEKKWTEEMWKQADVKVIGRVITNATYTI